MTALQESMQRTCTRHGKEAVILLSLASGLALALIVVVPMFLHSPARIRQHWNESMPYAYLNPATQNIPTSSDKELLRPPPPRVPDVFDIFIGIYRSGLARVHGPTVARWQQQQLIQDEEFCLEIDAHSQFIQDWDVLLVNEWKRTENEMAVLTTYPMGYDWMGPNLTRNEHKSSHLCYYLQRSDISDIPIIAGWKVIHASELPQMAPLWGGCLSFSKCHAERRAQNDKHMNWVFWGEEYLRSMQLWTRGYDLYSPSRHGHVVFHNWSDDKGMKKRFSDNVTQVVTQEQHDQEEHLAYNRLRLALELPFEGPVDAAEMDVYHGGKVRSVAQFLEFSGISNVDHKLDRPRCEQLHWVPYSAPEIIEQFLPGWTMTPSLTDSSSPTWHEMLERTVGRSHVGVTLVVALLWLGAIAGWVLSHRQSVDEERAYEVVSTEEDNWGAEDIER
ncbi:Aste57867_7151 [Aphanomyces stellatus]|uniref:Aste57867_7151 protein n=1 Tax=Aphanomyces stellatus TaxID=120398 RepID=A0A485KGD7_9STRA|nr:hypothetical protein As57867_007127 [Aphanomyces stellatus]VFT84083.1 Aste57867_7151 [Aphanomyces stellatus]